MSSTLYECTPPELIAMMGGNKIKNILKVNKLKTISNNNKYYETGVDNTGLQEEFKLNYKMIEHIF